MMRFSFLVFLWFITTGLNAQVGIGTTDPEATLHIDGNIKILNPNQITEEYMNGTKNIEEGYIPLYWDKDSHEIVTRDMEHPFIEGKIEYPNGSAPVSIDLDPNTYQLLIVEVSISPTYISSTKSITTVVENTPTGKMPIKNFEIGTSGKTYTFKAFFLNAQGQGLYYYDGTNIITPPPGQEPVWVARFIAIDKNYLSDFYELEVNYPTYWDCATCGAKYGISLGEYFAEDNKPTVVNATEDAGL